LKKERVANLVNVIQLCGVMRWMSDQLEPRAQPEFNWSDRCVPASFLGLPLVLDILNRIRDNVQMCFTNVVHKRFKGDNAVQCVSRLINIYKTLTLKNVPYVDNLVKFNLNHGYPSVTLEPVGVAGFPVSGSQAFRAVVCVLKALEVCYDISGFII